MTKILINLITNLIQLGITNINIYILNKEYLYLKKNNNLILRDFNDMLNSKIYKNHLEFHIEKKKLNTIYENLNNIEIPSNEYLIKEILIIILIIFTIFIIFSYFKNDIKGVNIGDVHDLINELVNLHINDHTVLKRIIFIRYELQRLLLNIEQDITLYSMDQIKFFILYIIENAGKGG